MISAYHSILAYQYDEWERYFDKICLLDIFYPLLKNYKEFGEERKLDSYDLKSQIHFILHCYSVESEKVILGQDWQKNKIAIYEAVCRPKNQLYEDLVLLKNDAIVETVNKWTKFQDNEIFSELVMLQDLKMEMQIAANSAILKSSGEVDFTMKYLCSTYVAELRIKIRDLQSEFIQNNQRLREAIKEVRNIKNKSTIGVEKFAI